MRGFGGGASLARRDYRLDVEVVVVEGLGMWGDGRPVWRGWGNEGEGLRMCWAPARHSGMLRVRGGR